MAVADEVGGDDLVLGVAEDALELVLRRLLDGRLDVVVLGRLGQAHGQIDDRHVGGGHAERHAGKLAVQLGDDLADSLGSASRRRDDVGGGRAASAPVLARRTVDGLLRGRVRVHGGHETLDNAELVVDDLGKRRQAVGCARRVAEHLDVRLVGVLVDTDDEHWRVRRRRRDDHLLGTASQVSAALVNCGEHTGRLDDVLGADLAPWNLSWVSPF